MYEVVHVEYPSNKSTTWRFKKLKEAYEFMKMLKKMYKRGYFCLNFDLK